MRLYDPNAQVVSFIFSCRTLNNFYWLFVIISICNKNNRLNHVSKIMSKCDDVFTENFPIFFFIIATNAWDFKQPYIFDKSYEIKKTFLSE